jgi:hypothetical protein
MVSTVNQLTAYPGRIPMANADSVARSEAHFFLAFQTASMQYP